VPVPTKLSIVVPVEFLTSSLHLTTTLDVALIARAARTRKFELL